MTSATDLEFGKYLLITTFRKDGRAVPTPVWAVRDGAEIYLWSAVDTGKIKRLRRSSKATISACDYRGNPSGPTGPARARLLDSAGSARVRGLLAKKYGILGKLTMLGSKIRRGADGTVGVRVSAD
jgi:hypothetical protein